MVCSLLCFVTFVIGFMLSRPISLNARACRVKYALDLEQTLLKTPRGILLNLQRYIVGRRWCSG